MSEIPLRYLIDCYASDGEAWEIKHYSLSELMDARIRRAETAERLANAVELWRCQSHAANWQAVVNCLHGYDLAREAVRKLDEKGR